MSLKFKYLQHCFDGIVSTEVNANGKNISFYSFNGGFLGTGHFGSIRCNKIKYPNYLTLKTILSYPW